MPEDKKPMPVDGSGSDKAMPDDNGELASRRDDHMPGGLPNAGESGGGAYPNPHSGKDSAGYEGGQSGGSGYYGKGQLGDKKVDETDNAPSEEE